MKYSITILGFFIPLILGAQPNRHLTIHSGLTVSVLQNNLWGGQQYKGILTNVGLDYRWERRKGQHLIWLNGNTGKIDFPQSSRGNTGDHHLNLGYAYLRPIRSLGSLKIDWSMGAGFLTFVDMSIQQRYSDGNAFAYDMGFSLQLFNQFEKKILLKNSKQLRCSFLVVNSLLTAHLSPGYANSNTQNSIDTWNFAEVTFGTLLSKMKVAPFYKFVRWNLISTLEYPASKTLGLKLQYNWQLSHRGGLFRSTGALHQMNLGVVFNFGKGKLL